MKDTIYESEQMQAYCRMCTSTRKCPKACRRHELRSGLTTLPAFHQAEKLLGSAGEIRNVRCSDCANALFVRTASKSTG
jgi:ribosomal protein S27E